MWWEEPEASVEGVTRGHSNNLSSITDVAIPSGGGCGLEGVRGGVEEGVRCRVEEGMRGGMKGEGRE